jgi:hypothetical protein
VLSSVAAQVRTTPFYDHPGISRSNVPKLSQQTLCSGAAYFRIHSCRDFVDCVYCGGTRGQSTSGAPAGNRFEHSSTFDISSTRGWCPWKSSSSSPAGSGRVLQLLGCMHGDEFGVSRWRASSPMRAGRHSFRGPPFTVLRPGLRPEEIRRPV